MQLCYRASIIECRSLRRETGKPRLRPSKLRSRGNSHRRLGCDSHQGEARFIARRPQDSTTPLQQPPILQDVTKLTTRLRNGAVAPGTAATTQTINRSIRRIRRNRMSIRRMTGVTITMKRMMRIIIVSMRWRGRIGAEILEGLTKFRN